MNILSKRVIAFKERQRMTSSREYIRATDENAVLSGHNGDSQDMRVNGFSHTMSNTNARGGTKVLALME